MERIDSLDNKKIKLAASLAASRARAKEKSFIAEGVRLGEEVLKAHLMRTGWEIRFGLATAEELAKERSASLARAAEAAGIAVYETKENVYKKAAQTVTPQGILFVVKIRETALDDLLAAPLPSAAEDAAARKKNAPLIAVLDGVQDPGNVGTILRTAEAVGATGAVLLEGTADIFGDKCVRAAAGTFFRLPCIKMAAEEFIAFAARAKINLYAAAVDPAAKTHLTADFRLPSAIAFGREGSGVSPAILASAEKIYIPMAGGAESFNVAQSSAIILYEALSQRNYR